jgi:hypothetical protein
MPTGSLCAERNVIGTALSADITLRRQDIKLVAVYSATMQPSSTAAAASLLSAQPSRMNSMDFRYAAAGADAGAGSGAGAGAGSFGNSSSRAQYFGENTDGTAGGGSGSGGGTCQPCLSFADERMQGGGGGEGGGGSPGTRTQKAALTAADSQANTPLGSPIAPSSAAAAAGGGGAERDAPRVRSMTSTSVSSDGHGVAPSRPCFLGSGESVPGSRSRQGSTSELDGAAGAAGANRSPTAGRKRSLLSISASEPPGAGAGAGPGPAAGTTGTGTGTSLSAFCLCPVVKK